MIMIELQLMYAAFKAGTNGEHCAPALNEIVSGVEVFRVPLRLASCLQDKGRT